VANLRNRLEALLAEGRDGAELRLALASQCAAAEEAGTAIEHLRVAVELKPDYSAAWKLLGKLLVQHGDPEAGASAYRSGIRAAESHGDLQAVREMRVFLARLARQEQQ
jgi:Tfp pilus assembly protein PilF